MKNHSIFSLILLLSLFSCREDQVPVVFDKVEVSNITETTAIFRILLKDLKESHSSEGIVFSKSPDPTIKDGKEGEFFSYPMDVSVGVSGLEPGTLYHVKAFVETSSGISYGETFSFTTLSPIWFTDSRDGQKYLIRKYGNKTWMVQNLNFRTKNSKYFMNDSVKYAMDFGRLYLYDEATVACPPGWRLPTQSDWTDLFKACGQSDEMVFASIIEPGTRLWQKNLEVDITNSNGFTIRPSGLLSLRDKYETFSEKGYASVLWSISDDGLMVKSCYFSPNSKNILQKIISINDKDVLYSLRCLKDN